jgi:two-component system NtrC family sensor kinase
MENARLLTEQREALEHQTATAEVLEVINSSPGDLAPVFDAMLEKAMRLCDVAFGMLWTYESGHFRVSALRGVTQTFADFLQGPLGPFHPGTGLGRMLHGEDLAIHTDMFAEEAYAAADPLRRAIVDLAGARSAVTVALRKERALLGAFTVFRQEVRPFSETEIALLQNFAAQAVIAMDNARLLNEQREALEQQTATAEVLQVINSSPGNLVPVFDAMLEKAMQLCEAAFGELGTYDGERFEVVALRGVPTRYAEYARGERKYGPGTGPALILEGQRVVHVLDLKSTDVYASGEPARRAIVDIGGARTFLLVPLLKDEGVVGFITIYRQEVRPFTEKQTLLLQSFAAQAVIAMDNARLLNEIRQRQSELRVTFDNMGDGVAMFDADLRLAAWNSNFQQIIDLPTSILTERPSYTNYLRLLAERGEFGTSDVEAELRYRTEDLKKELRLERVRPDGRVIEVRRNTVPGGGFVLIYSDITERKRSEEEIRAARDAAENALRELRATQANLIQAEKMASLGQLTAGIAHEIKNPLNFVNNFAALSVDLLRELKETAAPGFAGLSEKQRAEADEVSAMLTSNLEKITEHGKRADGIVRAMLEHSRSSSGERRMVDLNALIDEALNLAYHGARAQDQSFNIALERDFAKGIAPIELAQQDMTRVLLNLFSNGFYAATRRARKGADAGFMPTLKVTTIDAGEAVEVRVWDNGIGISADIKDKLFQPFFTTKPTGEGTGLGLSISYDIVTQQHGGSISVDSKAGEYSEFTLRLPRNPLCEH